MNTEARLEELVHELEMVKWDIIGLSETHLPGERITTLESGHILYQKNRNHQMGGVGLLVNKSIKSRVTKYCAISSRVIYIILKLNHRYDMQIINIYAPTSSANDEEVNQVYEDVTKARSMERASFTIVTGDFNAKIGKKEPDDPKYVGDYGLGERNNRGKRLVKFLSEESLYCLNTFFEKRFEEKWTWMSPNNKTKNEIDFILSNHRKFCSDVTVLNEVDAGSDHRLVRACFRIHLKRERDTVIKKTRLPTNGELAESKEEYQKEITKRLPPIKSIENMDMNKLNERIKSSIHAAINKICSEVAEPEHSKLSAATTELMGQRKKLGKGTQGYRYLNAKVKEAIIQDVRNHKTQIIIETIQKNKNPRDLKSKLSMKENELNGLKNTEGVIVSTPIEIAEMIEDFYTNLYKSTTPWTNKDQIDTRTILNVESKNIQGITCDEIRKALKKMRNDECPGEDHITSEMIRFGGKDLEETLQKLFNKCLQEAKIPNDWYNAEVVLLFQKGDATNINNYRPKVLLSHLYKLYSYIITKRLLKKLDLHEQARFRSANIMEHLQTLRIIIEKTTEYNIPIHLAFIAFDSIETRSFFNSMNNVKIDPIHKAVIKDICRNSTMHVKIDENITTSKINLSRGVRQGDPISQILFTLALDHMFKGKVWKQRGIKIDRSYLSHLSFEDHIVLISKTPDELNEMMKHLNEKSREIGLEMNIDKTKIMSPIKIELSLCNKNIENVDEYVYLGHLVKLGKDSEDSEIPRRLKLSWDAFKELEYVLRNPEIPMDLKREVYNKLILPVTTYGLETLPITKRSADRLKTTQNIMERAMLGVSRRFQITDEEISKKTEVTDVIRYMTKKKWRWAGHVARQNDSRWINKVIHWKPSEAKRSRGGQKKRWLDDIMKVAGENWAQLAQDRQEWKSLEEDYVQKCTG